MIPTTRLLARSSKPVAVFLNAARLDYDKRLDFSRLESLCDLRRHNVDKVTDPCRNPGTSEGGRNRHYQGNGFARANLSGLS